MSMNDDATEEIIDDNMVNERDSTASESCAKGMGGEMHTRTRLRYV
jgi:hypothetical protein